MEMHKGIPMFDCLKEKQPVKNYITEAKCPKHGIYGAEFVEYEEGKLTDEIVTAAATQLEHYFKKENV